MKNQVLIFSILLFIFIFNVISLPIQEENNSEFVFIRNINFHGNNAIETKLLNTLLGISPGQKLSQTQLETGLYNILNAYKKLGYLFAKISYESVPIAVDQIVLNINVTEGEFIGMGKIVLSGEPVFPKEQLLKIFNIQRSSVFDEDIFNNDIDRLVKFYSENGYPLVKIFINGIEIENNKININVNIQTGSIVRIRDFEVNGLKKTKKNIILREMTFKPGDIFDQRDIDESFRRLNNIGYFQNVSPISLSPDEEGFVSLSTDLTEGRTGRFSGLLGYSPSEEVRNGNKLIGSLELLETNLFGTGRRISIKARLGSMDVYEFCYTEPWILGSPIDVGIQIRSIQRTDSLLNYKFSERELVLDGKSRIFRMINVSLAITYKRIGSSMLISQKSDSNSILPFSHYLEDTKINNITEGRKYGIVFAIQRDSRDYYNNPTIGRLDRLSTEISSGDFRLFKVWLDLNQYFQIFNKQVLALGIHGARSWGEKIPPTELFYLGGANTLRGYKEDIFRGKGRILANSEYRFLVGRDSNFFLFLDAGTVYNNKLEPIKIGYGLGIRLESASGMMSMDYGLAKGDSILNGKIHVSLGATF